MRPWLIALTLVALPFPTLATPPPVGAVLYDFIHRVFGAVVVCDQLTQLMAQLMNERAGTK